MILALVLILASSLAIWKYLEFRKSYQYLKKIPGPKGYPIVGNLFDYNGVPMTENFRLSRSRCKEYYPGPWIAWLGFTPIVFLFKAAHIEIILRGLTHTSSKGSIYKFIEPWLGQSLLTAHGARWRSHRKLLTPAFHFKILKDFHGIIQEKADILVGRLQPLCDAKQDFDFNKYINSCTLDVICETAMGININAQTDIPSAYCNAINDVSTLAFYRQYTPWLYNNFLWSLSTFGKRSKECLSILHGFTDNVIRQRKQKREEQQEKDPNNNEPKDTERSKAKPFLDLMLDTKIDGRPMSDKEIRAETDTILFAGHDTSATNIAWTLHLLGNHPEIQERVYAELDNIFQGSDRKTEPDDLPQMKYLEMCIKETLRLFPSAPRIGRVLEEDINLDGTIVPKDTTIILQIFALHRDPENFANPDEFNPDNFLPENISKRHPYSYIPFSAGPRNCIGQKFAMLEIKLVLTSILRKFKIISLEPTEKVTLTSTFILTPLNGTKLRLEPRC